MLPGVFPLSRAKARTVFCHTAEEFKSTDSSHTALSSVWDIFSFVSWIHKDLILHQGEFKKLQNCDIFIILRLGWQEKVFLCCRFIGPRWELVNTVVLKKLKQAEEDKANLFWLSKEEIALPVVFPETWCYSRGDWRDDTACLKMANTEFIGVWKAGIFSQKGR